VAKASRFGQALLSVPNALPVQVATRAPDSNLCAVLKTLTLAFCPKYANYRGRRAFIEWLITAQNRGNQRRRGFQASITD
jgi:hypothetical protein